MSANVRLTVNGKPVAAAPGETLMNAALSGGIVLPQDCCAGRCGTCRVDVVSGKVDAQGTLEDGSVLACLARLEGDAEIRFEPQPVAIRSGGTVTSVRDLAGEIVEVVIEVTKPIPYLPGQYVKVEFAGLPPRDYSPTLTLDSLREINEIVLHIRRMDEGIVSSAMGEAIAPGRKVKVRGPFGHAFLRQGAGRIVLVSTGTGFAPVWSIAVAARLGQPHRPLTIVASARDPRNLYMRPALDWLAKHGVSDIVLAASGAAPMPPARHGRAVDFLPPFGPKDTVYAFGAPEMIEEVKRRARTAGARCYADPFLPSTAELPLRLKIARFFTGRPRKTSPVHAQLDELASSLRRNSG